MRKILIMLVLLVFVTGIAIGGVSAAKNKDGTATLKFKVTDDKGNSVKNTIKLDKKQVKNLEKGKVVKVKVVVGTVPDKRYKVKKTGYKKVPVYKTKKVKKTRWETKKVLEYEQESYSNAVKYEFNIKDNKEVEKYWNDVAWVYCGASGEKCSDSYDRTNCFGEWECYDHYKHYVHFKKKVTYYENVKYVYKYKKVKYTYYQYPKTKNVQKTFNLEKDNKFGGYVLHVFINKNCYYNLHFNKNLEQNTIEDYY